MFHLEPILIFGGNWVLSKARVMHAVVHVRGAGETINYQK